MPERWLLEGATRDRQTITARWTPSNLRLIDGVVIHEVMNVPKHGGYLTEIFRSEWAGTNAVVDQVFQNVLDPGSISAWHAHEDTTDRLFVSHGSMRIVLYDARNGSPTHGTVNELLFGTVRPALVIVPPHVWHGVQNAASTPGLLLNLVDRAYDYEHPDHWRLPADTTQIPYTWR